MAFIISIIVLVILAYLLRPKNIPKQNGLYSHRLGAWYVIKAAIITPILTLLQFWLRIDRFKNLRKEEQQLSVPVKISKQDDSNNLSFVASDNNGNIVVVRIHRLFDYVSEVVMVIRLKDGRILTNPNRELCVDETPLEESDNERVISSGGLRIRIIHPAKKFRLVYSGLMCVHGDEKKVPETVNVTFRLWFRAISDPAGYSVDFKALNIAKSFATEENLFQNVGDYFKGRHFEQYGEIRGLIDVTPVHGETESFEIALSGIRDYRYGKMSREPNGGYFVLRAKVERGLAFSLHAECDKRGLTHLVTGFVSFPNGYVYPVRWTDFHLAQLPVDGSLPRQFVVNISAHGRMYTLAIETMSTALKYQHTVSSEDSLNVTSKLVKVKLNDDQIGYGFIESNNRGETSATQPNISAKYLIHRIAATEIPKTSVPKFVSLEDSLCRHSSLTGGKASKLADIFAATKRFSDEESFKHFTIPPGFVVTTEAFEEFKSINPNISQILSKAISINVQPDELENICKELKDHFLCAQMAPTFLEELESNIESTLGSKGACTAIRSSAVGEDGADLSGAGQMETYLGRKGVKSISEAIRLCWASHFSFRAIQYRKQMGAKLDFPMAVLVQQIIDADVAGVLFTRHPDNGSTAHSIINASYGIGEGVVSGIIQPDSISIRQVDANNSNAIEIIYDVIAEKTAAFKVDKTGDGLEMKNLTASSDKCCLEESEIETLFKTGKTFEKFFGGGCDLEFALKRSGGQDPAPIFILQARPITTSDLETHWEMLREFDSPLASDCEILTTANVQEVMPGPMSPLSSQLWLMFLGLESMMIKYGIKPYPRFDIYRTFSMAFQHVFFNWTLMNKGSINEFNKKCFDIAGFGREEPDYTVEHYVEQNDMIGMFWPNYYTLLTLKMLLYPENFDLPGKEQKIMKSLPLTNINPVALLEEIETKYYSALKAIWQDHVTISIAATTFPITLMTILDSSLKFGPQVYEDMATMLSSCPGVYSAEVPTLLQGIAGSIKGDEGDFKVFMELSREEAAEWLLSEDSHRHGELFRHFLARHGHRCVRDGDIRERSWSQEPAKVVDALRAMANSNTSAESLSTHNKEIVSVDEAVDKVVTPMNKVQRIIMKWVLRVARKGVADRELTKSLAVKMTDNCRRTYYRLAEILTEMGYIPDPDLTFFFTHEELKEVAAHRSPKLVSRALRRRKLFPTLQAMRFTEIKRGHAVPLEEKSSEIDRSNIEILKGMAIGQGGVEGTARVIGSLAEAKQIKKGDILVVVCTDVGWTPYFPLLSGLVTELGGLISHGAVVAREYGLPCVVGVKKATQIIQTGDRIKIDSHVGLITVISKSY